MRENIRFVRGAINLPNGIVSKYLRLHKRCDQLRNAARHQRIKANGFIFERWTTLGASEGIFPQPGGSIHLNAFSTARYILQGQILQRAVNSNQTPWISPCLEHIIVSIHVHIVISRLNEDKTGTFRSRLPYL